MGFVHEGVPSVPEARPTIRSATRTATPLSIRWVNHASYVLTARDVRLITDPWLFGSAFNNGWDLISETQFSLDDFREITHIWFSHEHPDHFAPPILKAVDPAVRAKITVLFQETNDHKVLDFCAALGFKVQELRNHRWHALAPGLRVLCGKVPFYDSWLLVETRGLKILNTNDCVADGEAIADDIVRHSGRVDVLLTQFSYANWIGNPADRELREASAREKLERVKIQVATFRPTFTVPFASFVYFSHEENRHLNDAINTIARAHDFIRRETNTTPVVLYPGDQWDMGCDPARQNDAALVEDGSGAAHMSLSSESLAFLLKFDWGFDTLMVNGRFRASPRDYQRVMKTFYLGPLNNTGRYLHPRTLVDRDFVLRALRKFRG